MKKIFLILGALIIILASCVPDRKGRRESEPHKDVVETPRIKPNVNVYIENSESMDGYVKGVTEFEQTVYNYLSMIQRSEISNSLNLYYINSAIIPQKPVVRDFIEKLEPSAFKIKGGNRATTEISNIIDTILQKTDKNTISILVSDCVFSLGKKNDSKEYLINQQIGISNDVSQFIKRNKNDAAIIVFQLSSNFNGKYFFFDKKEGKEVSEFIDESRPYYIWLIGSIENVSNLSTAVPDNKFMGSGVEDKFSIIAGLLNVNYAIRDNTGNFKIDIDKNPKTDIKELRKDALSKQVQFSVNVDFSKLLLDDKYLCNTANYEIKGNYKLSITKSPENKHGYTHSLNFVSDKVLKGKIVVRLKKQMPEWVSKKNDNEGYSYVQNKTFGIYPQIMGVYSAFTDKSLYYTEIEININ